MQMPIKIKYNKSNLKTILHSNNRVTELPANPDSFLKEFLEKVSRGEYVEAVNMFFELRLAQFAKIFKELNTKKPEIGRIYQEMAIIRGTMLIDRLKSLMTKNWDAESTANYRNFIRAYNEFKEAENKEDRRAAIHGFISPVSWFIGRIIKEKKQIPEHEFTIEIEED